MLYSLLLPSDCLTFVLRSVNKYPITSGTTRAVIKIVDEVLSRLENASAFASPAAMNLIVTLTAKIRSPI
jgi:hypothetical protein